MQAAGELSLEPAGPARARPKGPKLGNRLSDLVSPIVVKEIRQGLRTKVFWISFGLLLLACLVIALFAYADQRAGRGRTGDFYFARFTSCLALVQFFVVPYAAYRSLLKEREGETWALLALTGLTPRRILWGKLGSFLLQGLLYGSAAAPFVLFCYYLNGIDLVTILVVLGLGWPYAAFLTAAAIGVGTLGASRPGRAVAHFGLLGFLLGATFIGQAVSSLLARESGLIRERLFLPVAAGILWVLLSFGAVAFENAAARLSPPTLCYSRGPRLAFLFQLIGSVALAHWVWREEGRKAELAAGFHIACCALVAMVGLHLAADRDGRGLLRRARPSGWALLRPGALRGFRLVVLALLCSSAHWLLALALSKNVNDVPTGVLLGMLAAPCYLLLYLSLALVVGRIRFLSSLTEPAASRLAFVALMALAAAGPPLAAVLCQRRPDEVSFNHFNPVLGLVNFMGPGLNLSFGGGSVPMLLVLGLTALSALVLADWVLHRRDQRTG
ncbi:MAG: ABC transporter permease [Myxococcales bacterium]|nr:ABC transporter permease [Myxococcales bacterium]